MSFSFPIRFSGHKVFRRIKSTVVKYPYLLFLLIVGSFLRLYNLRSSLVFLGDEGRDALIVSNFLRHFDIMLVGPTTSVGKIQLGPLFYYFMAPWLMLFNFDPVGPAFGVAVLGILTIPVLYYAVNRMFNRSAAVITTVLYTFGWVPIQFTRGAWNPNPMPLVVIILIYSMYRFYHDKKYIYLIISWFTFGIALQLHYMILLAGPALGLFWILGFLKAKSKKPYLVHWLIGLGVFVLMQAPLVIFDFRHDFLNLKGILEFFEKGHHSPQSIAKPILSIEGRVYQSVGQILGFQSLVWMRNIVSILITGGFLILSYINRKKKAFQIITAYFVISVIGLSLYSGDIYYHYIGFLFPIPFIMLGILLERMWSRKSKPLSILTAVVVTGFIIFNANHYSFLKPYGWSLDNVRTLAETVADDAGEHPYNIILLDDTKDYRAMNYRYYLSFSPNPPEEVGEFEKPEFVYIISLYEDLNKLNFETRELEAYFNRSFNRFSKPEDNAFIESKIIKKWRQPEGPWIFKLQR